MNQRPQHILTAEQLAYIDQIGLLVSEGGLARSVGRVLGLLLICDPPRQSAEDMQRLLGASSGSISNAVSILLKIQLIERMAIPGKRRLYYRLHPHGWERLLQARIDQARRGQLLIEAGIARYKGNGRLEGLHEMYQKSIAAMESIRLSQQQERT